MQRNWSRWRVRIFWVATDPEIENAMDDIVREHIAALMVGADPFFDTRRDKLTGLALRHKLPTMFQFREYAQAGGLMSHQFVRCVLAGRCLHWSNSQRREPS
jgi:hypothetical protein